MKNDLEVFFCHLYMEVFSDKKTSKNIFKFYCKFCDFGCNKKGDWNRHIQRGKHVKLTQSDIMVTEKTSIHTCDKCYKKYFSRNGLWKHKKKCIQNISEEKCKEETTSDKELIQFLMKESSEFKQLFTSLQEQSKQVTELAKKVGNNNTSNIVNNNQQFNLNFYLNETCKNAMNIMDFVSSLQVGIKELEETGRLGYAEGISKIFIYGLKQMNVNDRPIHCSDVKRETLYIKDNNEWNKETNNKVILTNAIKHVAYKNMKNISEWAKIHPEYKDSKSKENDRYLKIVSESMPGSTEETNKNYTKIIKNIVKETVIDKMCDTV